MQVLGRRTEVTKVHVDIDPKDVIDQLQRKFVNSCKDPLMMGGEYINQDGYWESWQDTHGSGITQVYRKATEEEVKTMEAFKIMRTVIDTPISK